MNAITPLIQPHIDTIKAKLPIEKIEQIRANIPPLPFDVKKLAEQLPSAATSVVIFAVFVLFASFHSGFLFKYVTVPFIFAICCVVMLGNHHHKL
ncbi:hypothetical protein CJU90_1891 [Yarrowia sp. C11]|nr:hypothetical protein CKK34_5919 [Yarrowia sp. E02]KAG5371826.1 hypothetical protein CJU90_1891 [Yarrowia sp. C11]